MVLTVGNHPPYLMGYPSVIKFQQFVGYEMNQALEDVIKLANMRHKRWPAGHLLEIGFSERGSLKDGGSAAIACGLLVEGIMTGKQWDPAFAVTGDMNADGTVIPIGGVRAKIRGATQGACTVVAIPAKNETAVSDILITDGPGPLARICIFGLRTFDEAVALADASRSQALQNALDGFHQIRTTVLQNPSQEALLLRTPHAVQRLQALLAVAPHCLSARYLLLHAQGRAPTTLSINASMEAADLAAVKLLLAAKRDATYISSLHGDELGPAVTKLRQLRPMLDPRLWPYVDAAVTFGELGREVNREAKTGLTASKISGRFKDLVGRMDNAKEGMLQALEKLRLDPEVTESRLR